MVGNIQRLHAFCMALQGPDSTGNTLIPWACICCCMQVMYYDGQFDDARLNVALACSAAAAGGAILNYTEVTSLIKVGWAVLGSRKLDWH